MNAVLSEQPKQPGAPLRAGELGGKLQEPTLCPCPLETPVCHTLQAALQAWWSQAVAAGDRELLQVPLHARE